MMKNRSATRWIALIMSMLLIGGLLPVVPGLTATANADAPLFSDGFESGFGNWSVYPGFTSTPSQSSYRVHNGKSSYAVDEDTDAIMHSLGAAANKVVSVWFYDDASNASSSVMAFAQHASMIGLGVSSSVSTTHYAYRIGGTTSASSVGRTTGWHNLVFDYRSGSGVTLYIDETQVAASATETAFSQIVLGDMWSGDISAAYFDDVSVQNELPWTAFTPGPTPTPPAAQSHYLTEGFENGFADWTVKYGPNPSPAPNTAQTHGGTYSYALSADQDAIEYAWRGKPAIEKAAVVWFYDDAADSSLRAMAFADRYLSAMSVVGLGVNTDVSVTEYVYRIGTDDVASAIPRTTGWHSLVFDYRSGTEVTLYVDGTPVATSPMETAFSRIAVGDYWNDGNSGNVYFDDIATQDYLPWETPMQLPPPPSSPPPTNSPPPPPTPVNGVWFSDSFENGFGEWTTVAGTPSVSGVQTHSGDYSYALDEDTDAIRHLFSSVYNKVAVVWFYDDAADTDLNAFSFVDDGGTVVGIGVSTSISNDKYVHRIGGSSVATTVNRTTGWHSFVFDYRTGTDVKLYVDETQVAQSGAGTIFNQISLGDYWSGGNGAVYFDDISIQDYLPWEPPLPPGVSFHEGFESGFAKWTAEIGTATSSSAQYHDGGNSYALNEDTDAIAHTMAANTNKVVVVWFYDDASDTSLDAFAFADRGDKPIGIGVATSTSVTEYVYRIGSVMTSSGVTRTTGWHNFAFDYRTGTDVSFYIDGTWLATSAEETWFNRIALGDYWSGSAGTVFFDDVRVQDYLPGETYPFTTPPAPVQKAAMGFEAAGDWRTEAYILEDNPTIYPHELLSATAHPLDPQGELAHGYTLSTSHVRQGNVSLKWSNHPYYPTLSTRNMPRDWSNSNLISFWAYSEMATNEEISMVVHSDNAATPYRDFFYYTFKVDWTGWKKVEIPLAAFTSYGSETAGWHNVEQLNFVTKMFFKQPNPATVLYLDQMELTSEPPAYIDQLLASAPVPDNMRTYITGYPSGFEAMTFDDYLLYVNNKIEYQDALPARQAAIEAENNAILAVYGLGLDSSYTLSQFVTTRSRITPQTEIVPFDAASLNHGQDETPIAQTDPIRYQNYWKSERAVYDYYPQFNSAPVSIDPSGHKYLRYGNAVIQSYNATKGKWFYLDIEPLFQAYVTEKHPTWFSYRQKDYFYVDQKIRFDDSGDAYMLAIVQEVKADGTRGGFDSILLYSNDKMKTWQFYQLEHPFVKFENIGTHNTEALARPPVITMHKYFTNYQDPAGYVTIPTKNNDGTLAIPSAVKFCDSCVQTGTYHSGDANIAVTSDGKLFLTYTVIELERSPSIPANHPSNDDACLLPLQAGGATEAFKCRWGTPAFAVSFDIDGNGHLTNKSSPVFIGYGGRYVEDHYWPGIAVDSSGRLHVIINGHADPITYSYSTNPGDISSWSMPEYVGDGNTYGTLDIDANDKLYIITRDDHEGYYFNLGLSTKSPGQSWLTHRYVVKLAKAYYNVWYHRATIDPNTGYLYLSYFSQTSSTQIFKDEYDAMTYIWPERDKIMNPDGNRQAVGTAKAQTRLYQSYDFPHPAEMVTIVSTDGGATWRLTESTDY